MKNILITGTSTGVGLEAALLFAQQGYRVYASMRNLEKAKTLQTKAEALQLNLEYIALDVSSPSSVQQAVEHIVAQDGHIDVLLNNAGAGFAKTTEYASLEEIRWVTEVNYHGVVYCTKAVLPYMRKQKAGHIISVSSVGGLVGQPFNEFYCAAKFAVEGYMESLASYVGEAFNINFSCVEPGGIDTAFMRSAVDKTSVDGQLAFGEYLPLFEQYLAGSQRRSGTESETVYQHPAEVAQVILQLAQAEKPAFRVRTSAWAEAFCALKTAADPDGTRQINQIKRTML